VSFGSFCGLFCRACTYQDAGMMLDQAKLRHYHCGDLQLILLQLSSNANRQGGHLKDDIRTASPARQTHHHPLTPLQPYSATTNITKAAHASSPSHTQPPPPTAHSAKSSRPTPADSPYPSVPSSTRASDPPVQPI